MRWSSAGVFNRQANIKIDIHLPKFKAVSHLQAHRKVLELPDYYTCGRVCTSAIVSSPITTPSMSCGVPYTSSTIIPICAVTEVSRVVFNVRGQTVSFCRRENTKHSAVLCSRFHLHGGKSITLQMERNNKVTAPTHLGYLRKQRLPIRSVANEAFLPIAKRQPDRPFRWNRLEEPSASKSLKVFAIRVRAASKMEKASANKKCPPCLAVAFSSFAYAGAKTSSFTGCQRQSNSGRWWYGARTMQAIYRNIRQGSHVSAMLLLGKATIAGFPLRFCVHPRARPA